MQNQDSSKGKTKQAIINFPYQSWTTDASWKRQLDGQDKILQDVTRFKIILPVLEHILEKGKKVFFNTEQNSFEVSDGSIYRQDYENAVKIPIKAWTDIVLKMISEREICALSLNKLKRMKETTVYAYIPLQPLQAIMKIAGKISLNTNVFTNRTDFIANALQIVFNNNCLGKIKNESGEPLKEEKDDAVKWPLRVMLRWIKVIRNGFCNCQTCKRKDPCQGDRPVKTLENKLQYCSYCNMTLSKEKMFEHRRGFECGAKKILPAFPCACYNCQKRKKDCEDCTKHVKTEVFDIDTEQERIVRLKEVVYIDILNSQVQEIVTASWEIDTSVMDEVENMWNSINPNKTREFYINLIKEYYPEIYIQDLNKCDLEHLHEYLSDNHYDIGRTEFQEFVADIRKKRFAERTTTSSKDAFYEEPEIADMLKLWSVGPSSSADSETGGRESSSPDRISSSSVSCSETGGRENQVKYW